MANETINSASVAGRYATALFDLAKEQNAVGPVEADMNAFDAMLSESEDLQRLVSSPVFSAEEQARAVSALLDKAGIGGVSGNFIRLVAKNRRLFAVPDMIKGFKALAASDRGEVAAEVVSAQELSAEQTEALKAQLKSAVGKDVQLTAKVDPSLLGGLIVKMGSRMVDSSLRTKLNNLKVAMKEVS